MRGGASRTLKVPGLGFKVFTVLGFRGFRVLGFRGFRVRGSGFRVKGEGFEFQGSGFRDSRLAPTTVEISQPSFVGPTFPLASDERTT